MYVSVSTEMLRFSITPKQCRFNMQPIQWTIVQAMAPPLRFNCFLLLPLHGSMWTPSSLCGLFLHETSVAYTASGLSIALYDVEPVSLLRMFRCVFD